MEIQKEQNNMESDISRISKAVAEAGGLPKYTEKQLEKRRKREQAYWNSMITRAEARDLMMGLIKQHDEKLRMLFITVSSLVSAVKEKGLCTQEELDELAKPIIQQIYGTPEKENKDTEDVKSE